jgi:pimeloyl-ACP methyl ester carboxylesterase
MTVMSPVTGSDGVTLAVYRYTDIDPLRPTILAIHGWPDNHHVWDGVAEEFAESYPGRYNFVAYDVRGAGESSRPAQRSGYGFTQLVSDIDTVIDSLGVETVHLLAHDWGSIQAWAAVTDESAARRLASFTSISGPHLNYAGAFMRSARGPRTFGQVVRQLLASWYIGFFLCPVLPEISFRSGLGVKLIEALERIGAGPRRQPPHRSIGDYVNGLELYRANMPGPLLSPGTSLPKAGVAVQVLVPRKDIAVTPALQRFTGAILEGGRVVEVEGGHWVVESHPAVVARLASEWIAELD